MNVMGVVCSVGELDKTRPKSSENKKPLDIRRIELVDKTGKRVNLSLWGREAQKSQFKIGDIVLVLKGVVANYMGEWGLKKHVQTDVTILSEGTTYQEEYRALRDWWNQWWISRAAVQSSANAAKKTPAKRVRATDTTENTTPSHKINFKVHKLNPQRDSDDDDKENNEEPKDD
jgi:hypothetical protein